jgi:hypothetical protein
MDCTVFPKPISSARIPLIPYRDRKAQIIIQTERNSHSSTSTIYSNMLTVMAITDV